MSPLIQSLMVVAQTPISLPSVVVDLLGSSSTFFLSFLMKSGVLTELLPFFLVYYILVGVVGLL